MIITYLKTRLKQLFCRHKKWSEWITVKKGEYIGWIHSGDELECLRCSKTKRI